MQVWTQVWHPCVECGQVTGNFCREACDLGYAGPCYAEVWMPNEDWAPGQRTSLCPSCEDVCVTCRYCRRVSGCSPGPWEAAVKEPEPDASPVYEAS